MVQLCGTIVWDINMVQWCGTIVWDINMAQWCEQLVSLMRGSVYSFDNLLEIYWAEKLGCTWIDLVISIVLQVFIRL